MTIRLRSPWRVAAAVLLAASMAAYGQGTQMLPNTQLEVNLAFPELAKWGWEQGVHGYHLWYDNAHYDIDHPAIYRRCGSGLPHPDQGAPPVRTCMQQILHSYRMQGVTGVRIMFEMHDILDGPAWLVGFGNLLDDLIAARIYNVTLTPGWGGANWTDGIQYRVVRDPAPRDDDVCNNPPPPAVPYFRPAFMRFSPTSPHGERASKNPEKRIPKSSATRRARGGASGGSTAPRVTHTCLQRRIR